MSVDKIAKSWRNVTRCNAGMMKMQQGMMTYMMEHMAEGKDSMAMCPMMKHK